MAPIWLGRLPRVEILTRRLDFWIFVISNIWKMMKTMTIIMVMVMVIVLMVVMVTCRCHSST